MSNFKFHLVTVVGLFLALAVGIFIGSSFTEEGIIHQQRDAIDHMRADLEALRDERRELLAEANRRAETMALMHDWLGDMTEVYWLGNPVKKSVMLIHNGDFGPDYLGEYLRSNVIKTQVVLEAQEMETAQILASAIISGDGESLLWMSDKVTVQGDLSLPDYVLLALDQDLMLSKALAEKLLDAGVPVVALGRTGWEGLAELVRHPLYASISHFDTPLGLYCLGAIFQGQLGHYGVDNILPPGGLAR